MATKKATIISYDIDMDIRIINAIAMSPGETINISQLRNTLECYAPALYKHLEQLGKWGLVLDQKPESNGFPRRITLLKPHKDCMDAVMKLKHAIDIVNEYFG